VRVVALAALCGTLSLPAHAEIRVALAAPFAGREAATGLAMKRGLEAAIGDANAAGGVLGEKLELVTQDDGCAGATGEGAASALLALAPAVVIGHPCSSAAVAAAALYAKAGVLFIAVGARHPDVTGRAPAAAPLLRLAGRDDRQGAAAAHWLLAHAPQRRIAIVQDRTAYARAIADGAVLELKGAGLAEVPVLALVAGRSDYGEIALKLSETGAEAVLFAGYPTETAIVLTGLAERRLTPSVLATDSHATAAFAAFAAASPISVHVLLPDEPSPHGASHGDGGDLRAVQARAQGALEAWIGAVKRTGSHDGATLTRTLRGGSIMTGTLGEIRFDANGDVAADEFFAASAHDGQWERER
jgi:branched-chain amino acid transport system substrate-binding protein